MTQTVPQKRTATSFVAARFDQGVSRTVDFGEGSSEIHTLSQTEVNSAGFGHRPLAENRSPKTEADGQYGVSHTDAFNLTASNIGFKLLKKSGWKEGTGLGAAEQGIINPVPAFIKHGREGIGAEKEATINNYRVLKKKQQVVVAPKRKESKAQKRLSKRAKKVHAEEQRMLEHQFTRDFLREFWPDNV